VTLAKGNQLVHAQIQQLQALVYWCLSDSLKMVHILLILQRINAVIFLTTALDHRCL
jgi:hypothetical protein